MRCVLYDEGSHGSVETAAAVKAGSQAGMSDNHRFYSHLKRLYFILPVYAEVGVIRLFSWSDIRIPHMFHAQSIGITWT